MIVLKFGGTSVKDAAAIRRLAAITEERLAEKPVVIVSALSGITDSLIAMAKAAGAKQLTQANKTLRQARQRHLSLLAELVKGGDLNKGRDIVNAHFDSLQDVLRGVAALGELSPRTMDNVLCMGELLSSNIVALALKQAGMETVFVDSRQCVVTDGNHTRAVPQFEETNQRCRTNLKPLLAKGQVPVMGGFIASTEEGISTTLGRGGSDFSAAIVGAALRAKRIEIWTDVSGMMTTDPRICPDAQRIELISFDEAAELAFFGAKVLHPATLIPAIQKNIPVSILNSQDPINKGTCIRSKAPRSHTVFRAIALKKNVKVVSVKSPRMLQAHGFFRALFDSFDKHAMAADLVSTSEVNVSVALDSSRDLDSLLHDLAKLGDVQVEDNKAIVCLVGTNIVGRVGVAAEVFAVLAAARINMHMISQGASEINISVVIEERDAAEAVKHLHRHFFERTAGKPNGKGITEGFEALPLGHTALSAMEVN